MNLCHVVNYTIYGHVKVEFQCYFKCIYLDLAVVNIVEGGIDMIDTTMRAESICGALMAILSFGPMVTIICCLIK